MSGRRRRGWSGRGGWGFEGGFFGTKRRGVSQKGGEYEEMSGMRRGISGVFY